MAMPKEDKPLDLPADPASPEARPTEQDEEQEMGDFITRHVLEKDSVFFEG
jgi:hypothetical protein